MKWGVLVFPGTNREQDAVDVLERLFQQNVRRVWHTERDLSDLDAIMLPGGFSYGDYLRCGAIARFSPVMDELVRFAGSGRTVFGVCNGFQILTEAGLLPGTLLRNTSLRFINAHQPLRIERTDTRFTRLAEMHQVITVPIAHNEGNYFLPPDGLKRLEDRGGVLFRYCTAMGEVTSAGNPNGSVNNIAGVVNEAGNVLGMMPHPENTCDPVIGGTDGRVLFESMIGELVAV
ncbi:MAG: phosphoribosylformylglycinamidine synthase subunit PurQ [bacterium]